MYSVIRGMAIFPVFKNPTPIKSIASIFTNSRNDVVA